MIKEGVHARGITLYMINGILCTPQVKLQQLIAILQY